MVYLFLTLFSLLTIEKVTASINWFELLPPASSDPYKAFDPVIVFKGAVYTEEPVVEIGEGKRIDFTKVIDGLRAAETQFREVKTMLHPIVKNIKRRFLRRDSLCFLPFFA